ncbi:neural Wiskott-Aldrich syndrome protein-like [Chiloscyllium plagiosum]|uniref:neural Wiskott-Aldrich syndrome protein-like n=1 Tax=Chiloscyllium plagiosum TaxID=36176 RepID=UPI001CB84552|nr:neural Wiskott-Aldrich syndrome protein-like [Chiloscyllium plagiosum]
MPSRPGSFPGNLSKAFTSSLSLGDQRIERSPLGAAESKSRNVAPLYPAPQPMKDGRPEAVPPPGARGREAAEAQGAGRQAEQDPHPPGHPPGAVVPRQGPAGLSPPFRLCQVPAGQVGSAIPPPFPVPARGPLRLNPGGARSVDHVYAAQAVRHSFHWNTPSTGLDTE